MNQNSTNSTLPMVLTKKQQLLLKALEKEYYIISYACKKVGIDRKTYYNWLKIPEFKKACEELDEDLLTLIEDRLKTAALQDESWAIKFFLSRRHPDYKPKLEVEEEIEFTWPKDETN